MDPIRPGKTLRNVIVDQAKVRLFCEAFGVSIRELARRMDVSHAYLFKAFRASAISAPKAQRLVEVLQDIARSAPLSPFAFLLSTAANVPSQPRIELSPAVKTLPSAEVA